VLKINALRYLNHEWDVFVPSKIALFDAISVPAAEESTDCGKNIGNR
jgi:hypothetical protein